MDYILIIVGFVALVFGANFLVDGAVGVAKRFNVPDLVIGLTIVAFGTSAPELVVNLVAAIDPGTTDIALTNIIGSNMINTYVILGATALVYPIRSQLSSRRFDIPLSLLAPVMILVLAWITGNRITWYDGVIMLLVFVFFMYRTIKKTSTVSAPELEEISDQAKPKRLWVSLVLIAGGLVMLVVGGQLIVRSAINIATAWGVSQAIIGLTVVALGTSLPELATSVVAAIKKNSDIALGNVIGSNIFNVFFVLSTSALIRPLQAYPNMQLDLIITALGSLLVLIFVYTNKKHEIKRWGGAVLLLIYAVYLVWMIKNVAQ